MPKNISGEFFVEIGEKEYALKMTYGVAEQLEQRILGKSIMQCLTESLNGAAKLSDVVSVFYTALGDRDRRDISLEDFGQEMLQGGLSKYASTYSEMLTYALTGEATPKTENIPTKKN
jgi:hypothetical protein